MRDDLHDRRRFLVLGGATVGAAALLAACGSDDETTEAAATTTTVAAGRDIARLRTASSLEKLSVAILKQGVDGGLVKTPAAVEAVKLFQAQCTEHAAVFDGHTSRLGGEAMPDANPALLAQIQPRLTDEAAVLRAAFEVAQIAAATYQAAVGSVDDTKLNVIYGSVAGVEARHAALLATLGNLPAPNASFGTVERAIS